MNYLGVERALGGLDSTRSTAHTVQGQGPLNRASPENTTGLFNRVKYCCWALNTVLCSAFPSCTTHVPPNCADFNCTFSSGWIGAHCILPLKEMALYFYIKVSKALCQTYYTPDIVHLEKVCIQYFSVCSVSACILFPLLFSLASLIFQMICVHDTPVQPQETHTDKNYNNIVQYPLMHISSTFIVKDY